MPVQIDPARGLFLELLQCGAIDGVDHDARAAIGDADDPFARHRLAAIGAAEVLVCGQAHDGPLCVDLVGRGLHEFGIERLDHPPRRQLRAAQPCQQVLLVGKAQRLCGGAQRLVGCLLADVVEGGAGKLVAQLDETTAVFFAQGFADRGLGAARGHDVDPAGLRMLALGRDDLDRLAVLEPGPQRHADAVDLGRHAGIPDAGMDRVGIVQRRRTPRKLHHIALGREAEHLIRIHLELDVFEKLVVIALRRAARSVLAIHLAGSTANGLLRAHAVTVGPVGGDARLGHLVHLAGADLHLDPLAVAARNRRVDRAVAVRSWAG